ncbi:uncharacterized protein [Diadema antillarum]|uniref:uncharacterized protein n=1 Tax=Diadema antillarum TaxID=105358 RepID=UPI003A88952B
MNLFVSNYTRNCLYLRRLRAHVRCFHDAGKGLCTGGAAIYPRLSAACAGDSRSKLPAAFSRDSPSYVVKTPSCKRERSTECNSTVICRTISLSGCSMNPNVKYFELYSIRMDRNRAYHDTATTLANDVTPKFADSHLATFSSQTSLTTICRNPNLCRMSVDCRRVLPVSSCTSSNLLSSCASTAALNVRSIRTIAYTCQEDKQDSVCNQNQNDDGSSNPEVVEWVHPDQRTDSILGKDPELKSLLRELASDFGRDEKTPVETDNEHVKAVPPQNSTQIDKCEAKEEGNDESSPTEGRMEDLEFKIAAGDVDCDTTLQAISKGETPEKKYVFSIDDMVALLRAENAQDICVIKIPKEKQYVDFFIVATGRSPRHLKAMSLYINQQYKARKTKRDAFILVEGENTDDWICMDFGNIVVHLMSEEMREFYELEKLWTLGPGYDDQLQRLREYEAKLKETLSLNEVKATPDNSSPQSNSTKGDDVPEVSFVK